VSYWPHKNVNKGRAMKKLWAHMIFLHVFFCVHTKTIDFEDFSTFLSLYVKDTDKNAFELYYKGFEHNEPYIKNFGAIKGDQYSLQEAIDLGKCVLEVQYPHIVEGSTMRIEKDKKALFDLFLYRLGVYEMFVQQKNSSHKSFGTKVKDYFLNIKNNCIQIAYKFDPKKYFLT
jgi:hypothetical protein